MRRFAALLGLLAALSGTPLRQAEAASDLARALFQDSLPGNLQSPDGGVGDDSGVVTLTAMHADLGDDGPPMTCLFIMPPDLGRSAIAPTEAVGLKERI